MTLKISSVPLNTACADSKYLPVVCTSDQFRDNNTTFRASLNLQQRNNNFLHNALMNILLLNLKARHVSTVMIMKIAYK
jgi:hypothetical protein